LDQVSISFPANIAESNGKFSLTDRCPLRIDSYSYSYSYS
jgi:hypothetical protein